MVKNLIYTALGLMGLMGTLSIGVVNAETTISEPYGHIEYTLNGNEYFEAQAITITGDDGTVITILDRNLGATAAGTGCDYTTNGGYCPYDKTYGYHFQWGNNHGFKPGCDLSGSIYFCSDTITSSAVNGQVDATTISYNPASQEFYNSGVFYEGYKNWLTDNSKVDLWGGSTGGTDTITSTSSLNGDNWKVDESTVTNRQGPCPRGWHVPSIGELNKLVSMMTGSNNSEKATQLHSDLYIPFAGYRSCYNASLFSMGRFTYLWSSSSDSASTPYSRRLTMGVEFGMDGNNRTDAYSVRCFYDSYQPFTQSFTLTFDVSDDNGSTIAETESVASGTVIALNTGDFEAIKDGWTHLGWNTDASAIGVLESITMTEDTTVYANFSKDLAVNYVTGAGVSTIQKESDSCSMYNTGTSCTLTVPDITEDEGYENGVWKKGNDTVNPGEDITLTSDLDTYTATASAKKFAIRFVDGSGENENVVYTGAYKSDTSNITYPSWTRDGYTISWDNPIPATMPLNGKIITASWTENANPSGGYSGGGSRRSSATTPDSSATSQNDKNTENSEESSNTPKDFSADESASEGQEILSPLDSSFTKEQKDAYEFAKEHGITTMPTINDANMNGKLTRIAMAKMLSYYAINVLGQKPDETRNNQFNDITDKLDAQYDNGVTLSYQLGIMGINMPNNKFRPNDLVTRAEFATALSRMLYSTLDGKPYYTTHLEKLKSEGILKNDDYKMKELRGYVMIMFMRSTK